MALVFFLIGLIIGSFLNVVILRLRREELITGRSRCLSCNQPIRWYDNIPLVSFILLKGRCRSCHQKISWQYPGVELASGFLWLVGWYVIVKPDFYQGEAISKMATGIASLTLAMTLGQWLQVLAFGIFASFLLALFVFDFRWSVLPDQITLPGIAVCGLLNLILGRSWLAMLVSAALGAAWFGAQYLVSRGRWVGSGDIRLGALMGIILVTWQALLTSLFMAYLVGAVVAVILLVLGKKSWGSQLPFGSFLTATTIITLLYGEAIWQWYWNLVGW